MTTGILQINYNMYTVADRLQIINTATGAPIFDSGIVNRRTGSGQIVPFNLGTGNTQITILINGGPQQGTTVFNYNIFAIPNTPINGVINNQRQ
jgi:hypothetical protein